MSWGQAEAELRNELQTTLAPDHSSVAERRYNSIKKEPVRLALCTEQQDLCVFCETKVDRNLAYSSDHERPRKTDLPREAVLRGVRIAHWKPRKVAPSRALDWRNVYASCSGVWPSGNATCDEHQRSIDPALAPPANRDWGTQLEFGADGKVQPRPGAPNAFVNAITPSGGGKGVWNLNHPSLVAARKAAIDDELARARHVRNQAPYPKKQDVIDEALVKLTSEPRPFVTARRQALERWRR